MARQACIIHYDSIRASNNLIKANDNTFETLLDRKKIRERLGGENYHAEQCRNLPEIFEENHYFYHRECYQKFTYAKALMKRKMSKDGDQWESSKIQRTTRGCLPNAEASITRGLFPEMCMICKKKDLKVKHSLQSLSKIVTKTSEKTLKEAAFARNDKEMIIAVSQTDLIAKEFQKHEKCYLDYTRIVRKSSSAAESTSEKTCSGNGDFDSVLSLIDNDVLAGQQCLSMETIMMKYNGSIGTKQRRFKLKERLLKSYGDKLVFLQAEYHTPQV